MRQLGRAEWLAAAIGIFLVVSLLLYARVDLEQDSQAKFARARLQPDEYERRIKHLEEQIAVQDHKLEAARERLANAERANDALKEQANVEDAQAGNNDNNQNVAPPDNARRRVAPAPGGNKAAVVARFTKSQGGGKPAIDNASCDLRSSHSFAQSDIQMLDVYSSLPFDNPNGGVWRQGWNITYDRSAVEKEEQLVVYVVPHSHNDPGWLKTFEQYYEDQTKKIHDLAMTLMPELSTMRFIQAEMSFLELWWRNAKEEHREAARRLVRSGNIEIVSGGWVMTDEANSHYFSILNQLFEGHEFINNTFGPEAAPKSHWSIDPFGLSPTVSFFMRRANLSAGVLQRVHYSVKKRLALSRQLEFRYRQLWAGSSADTDFTTHVMPFFSYDVPHTCGPEPSVCCQFDFGRLTAFGCPWNIPPQRVTDDNVAARAELLYDQYRKRAQLYAANVLLVPLGDDFRYTTESEWRDQHDNYQALFKYMNAKKEWNIKAQFGTLGDYFAALSKRTSVGKPLPVLSGDFFTYADRDDHYWSGYYTSRPFYKRLDRVLHHHLRSAELLFSWWTAERLAPGLAPESEKTDANFRFKSLIMARRAHALFQHHDGVTGTSKPFVVNDYAEKMRVALEACASVSAAAIGHLANGGKDKGATPTVVHLDTTFPSRNSTPKRIRLTPGSKSLLLFNSVEWHRKEVVCVEVESANIRVSRADDPDVALDQQILPLVLPDWEQGRLILRDDAFELCFSIDLPPVGMRAVQLSTTAASDQVRNSKLAGSALPQSITGGWEEWQPWKTSATSFSIETGHLTAHFDKDSGLLRTVERKLDSAGASSTVHVNLHFVEYGARGHHKLASGNNDDLSGAYLFLPDGPARNRTIEHNKVLVVSGPLVSRVYVLGPPDIQHLHTVQIEHDSSSLLVQSEIDLRPIDRNIEVAMRLSTSVKSGSTFYTDLNGYQMIRRNRWPMSKLPLQAQFYPMSSAAWIEDETTRLSLLGHQALGVASLSEGALEVMLDRKLIQDDNRGLGEGMQDNVRVTSSFRLLVEPFRGEGANDDKQTRIGHPSLTSTQLSRTHHYPVQVFISTEPHTRWRAASSALRESLPCDHEIVVWRVLSTADQRPRPESALVMRRTVMDCRSSILPASNCTSLQGGSVSLPTLLVSPLSQVRLGTLTPLGSSGRLSHEIQLSPMDVATSFLTHQTAQ